MGSKIRQAEHSLSSCVDAHEKIGTPALFAAYVVGLPRQEGHPWMTVLSLVDNNFYKLELY